MIASSVALDVLVAARTRLAFLPYSLRGRLLILLELLQALLELITRLFFMIWTVASDACSSSALIADADVVASGQDGRLLGGFLGRLLRSCSFGDIWRHLK